MKTTRDHHLLKRNDIYWLQFKTTFKDDTGKKQRVRIQESLKTKNLEEAIRKRDERLNEYQLKTRNQFRENILHKVKSDAEKIAEIQAIEQREKNKISLADAWSRYKLSPYRKQPKDSTFNQYSFQWDKFYSHIKDTASDKLYLEDITKEDAEKFLQGLSNLTPNTYNKILRTLRGIFKTLWRDRSVIDNPFYGFESKELETTSHRELTISELKDVCGKAEGELKTLLAIGVYTGLRLKDATLLRWQDVSLSQNRITVIPAKTSRKNKILKIPLHYVLKSILLDSRKVDRTGYVLSEIASNYLKDPTRITNMIQSHFKACGIETQKIVKDKKAICVAGYHSLRHSLVSILASGGTSQALTMELVGHGSPQIHRVYTHAEASALSKAVNSIPSFFDNKKMLASGEKAIIDVKAEIETTSEYEKRVKQALALIRTAKIQKDTKSRLLQILKGKINDR